MDTSRTAFMRDLEARFKRVSGMMDRAYYKIYYCQVRQAPILTLGINPGGDPSSISAVDAAATSFYEEGEHDVLDCEWRENSGLRKLLTPLVGGDPEAIRTRVVKTNIAFHRSAKRKDLPANAMDQAAPFLAEIISVVKPAMVLLTGVALSEFTTRFTSRPAILVAPERDPRVNQVVFAASRATLKSTGEEALVVQLAHASQFSWTYAQYHVADRIAALQA